VLRDENGEPQVDENWPDEMALNTSTPESRAALALILGEWIEGCRTSGYQAVEFDNLDSYSRFDGLTLDHKRDFRVPVGGTSARPRPRGRPKEHGRARQPRSRRDRLRLCHQRRVLLYDECSAYSDVYGDQFLDIEYQTDDPHALDGLCDDPDIPVLTIVRDRALSPAGDPDSVFWSCDI